MAIKLGKTPNLGKTPDLGKRQPGSRPDLGKKEPRRERNPEGPTVETIDDDTEDPNGRFEIDDAGLGAGGELGPIEFGVNNQGEVSVVANVPLPTPGVNARVGVVISPEGVGGIVGVGILGGNVAVDVQVGPGCQVITTFSVPGWSHSVVGELPNCEQPEEEEEEEEPPPGEPPGRQHPSTASFYCHLGGSRRWVKVLITVTQDYGRYELYYDENNNGYNVWENDILVGRYEISLFDFNCGVHQLTTEVRRVFSNGSFNNIEYENYIIFCCRGWKDFYSLSPTLSRVTNLGNAVNFNGGHLYWRDEVNRPGSSGKFSSGTILPYCVGLDFPVYKSGNDLIAPGFPLDRRGADWGSYPANGGIKDWFCRTAEDVNLEIENIGGCTYFPQERSPELPIREEPMDQECCQAQLRLLRKIYLHLGVETLGTEIYPEETEQIGSSQGDLGNFAFPFKVPARWVNPELQNEIQITNMRQALMLVGGMVERLERVIGFKEFKIADPDDPKLMQKSGRGLVGWIASIFGRGEDWQSFTYPDPDDNGREDGEVKSKELEIRNYADALRYLVQATNRLEWLFPVAELKNSEMWEGLIKPGAGKDKNIKIQNLIQFQELMLQYLNSVIGNPRQKITIKDANPAREGDQEMSFTPLSISDLLAEMTKLIMDSEGDIDSLMNLCLRDFRNNLANRVQIVQIHSLCEALLEDTGMLEKMEHKKLKLEGDPYAGHWLPGQGFQPSAKLDANTEEATEELLEATLKNTEIKVKVSTRDNKDRMDIRDLIVQLARHIEQMGATANPDEAIKAASFKVKTEMALFRSEVKKAAASSRPRTKKRR